MDMCLAEVIGQKASASTRPRMDVLATWLSRRANVGDRVEACVFANVAAGQEAQLARWVANLRQWGWSVFVKPKQHRRDDIDDEMVRHIERHFRQGTLVELIVASHDGRAFASALGRYAQAGVAVTLLGFRERMNLGAGHEGVEFLDLEHVSGVFAEPLPRTNLFDLPRGGRWFESFTEIEGVRAEPIPDEDLAEAVPTPDLDRADVVAFVRQALSSSRDGGLSLQEAGELLRASFPGFTLEGSGYLSVSDLLDELQASGDVAVSKSDNGHLLHAVPTDDPHAAASSAEPAERSSAAGPLGPPTDAAGTTPDAESPTQAPPTQALSSTVIDLTDRAAPSAPVTTPATNPPPTVEAATVEAATVEASEAPVAIGHAVVVELATFGDRSCDGEEAEGEGEGERNGESVAAEAETAPLGATDAEPDADEQRPAATTPGREWPTADQVARANPIYRMFGFDPNGAA